MSTFFPLEPDELNDESEVVFPEELDDDDLDDLIALIEEEEGETEDDEDFEL